MHKAIQLSKDGPLIATSYSATIPWSDKYGNSGELQNHNPQHSLIATSQTSAAFAMYGLDREIEVWSMSAVPTLQMLRSPRGVVSSVTFSNDGSQLLIGTVDGAIYKWSEDEGYREIANLERGIAFMRTLQDHEELIVGDSNDALWLVSSSQTRLLAQTNATIVSAVPSSDSQWLAVGTSGGNVHLYKISMHALTMRFPNLKSIEHIAFSPDSTELAISTGSQLLLYDMTKIKADTGWIYGAVRSAPRTEIPILNLYIAYSPDNKLIALTSSDGGVWLHQRFTDKWTYKSIASSATTFGQFSEDSASFTATDASGRAITIATDFHHFNDN
jgi:WD40 repeat protein